MNTKSDYKLFLDILQLRFPWEMRFQSKLAEARTNSKALSRTCRKIVTIQRNSAAISEQKLTKLLVKVNLQNSVGPVHVVMSPENTVRELMKAAIEIYVKEKRRPLLPSSDSRCYELHYSQFSLESKCSVFSPTFWSMNFSIDSTIYI